MAGAADISSIPQSGLPGQQKQMDVQGLLVRALTLQAEGSLSEAADLFQQVLRADPANGPAYYSLALMAYKAGDTSQAISFCTAGVAAVPSFAPLQYLNGVLAQAMGQMDAALASYNEALRLKPEYAEVLINSGVLMRELLRHKDALERFNQVLLFDPNSTIALANCAIILTEFKQSEQAIRMFERLLALQPDYDYGLGLLSYERLHICDWTDFDQLTDRIVAGVRAGGRVCKTLPLMALSDYASDHLLAASTFAAHHNPRQNMCLWNGERYRHDRIRLGYVSPDFREHPVGYLMAGVFERHDRRRFETHAFSIGMDDGSSLRARIAGSFDEFIDCRGLNAAAVARRIREAEIDVLVDLAGYTADSRMQIFAHKPAPVQVNYLGYPGTSGADYMDYILADRVVIPPEHWQFYTERVVYLPDAYLPAASDIHVEIGNTTRAAHGLPEEGVVFCCFNHDYKISPPMFSIWMRLLKQVPGSVLWLMGRSQLAQDNLRAAASSDNVDPSRLVFASRVPSVEDHLARYGLADMFLDTHPYNAHTTAADALLAGLPVVTFLGNAFPARVAASLLHAVGLPQLVAESMEDYEQLALGLARDPEAIQQLKAQLRDARTNAPLFDADGYCRGLEAAYIAMWRQTQLGGMRDALG